jgi:16S rRNA (adenine(1408)-N(1))-methyltransferase
VIGLDAVPVAMADASRRAARPARKGGLPNALFVVAAAERLPPELGDLADEVTIHFPWGSLLRGLLGDAAGPTPHGDGRIASAVAGLLRPGGRLRLVVSLIERDRPRSPMLLGPVDARSARFLPRIVGTFERVGLRTLEVRPAGAAELAASGSSWARRLGAGSAARAAWWLHFERPPAGPRD